MSLQSDLDALIDTYESNETLGGKKIRVAATAQDLARFAEKDRSGYFKYRGRLIVALKRRRPTNTHRWPIWCKDTEVMRPHEDLLP